MVVEGFQEFAVQPDSWKSISSASADPGNWAPKHKKAGLRELEDLGLRLGDLQKRLFIDRRHKLLILFQGMDTSGKGGTIRNVFRGVNPQGVHVACFDKPSKLELSHDYLWRIHKRAPANGEIVVFDRSHYEDILAVRVNKLKPPKVWQRRYRHLVEFERMLTDEGTAILKFFLHIDQKTQRERLQERLDNPAKNWKFDQSDLVARERWGPYMKAHDEVFRKTSTAFAPWYVIPSNRKWARNLLVARIVVAYLESLHLTYPKVDFKPGEIRIP